MKFEEAAQIDGDPEQLNEIFEVEEAAQTDPESDQLNYNSLDTIERDCLDRCIEQINCEADKSHSFILREISIERTLKRLIE